MESSLRIQREGKRKAVGDSHKLAFAGLFCFTLLLYVRPNDLFPELLGEFPLIRIVAVITLLAYVTSKLLSGEPLTIWPLELKMLAVITLLGVLFVPIAASPNDSFELLTDLFLKVVTIFILMINLIDTEDRLKSMMKLVVICGTVLAFFALVSYARGNFTVLTRGEEGVVVGLRITGIVGGIFENPNDLATSLDLLIPLAVALAMVRRGLARAAYFACAIVLALGVIFTFSRGGFLGLVAMGGLLLWKIGRRNRAATALAFFIMAGALLVAMPVGYSSRITSIFDTENDPTGSAQARRDLLERAASVAANHLILGVGIGNFSIYSLHDKRAHNSFLEISAELGVLGLIAYLVMIFAPLRSLRRMERESLSEQAAPARPDSRWGGGETYHLSAALQASLLAYIVCSCFGSIQYHWFLYYPLAYAISLRRIYAEGEVESAARVAPQKLDRQKVRAVLWKPRRPRQAQLPAAALGSAPQSPSGN